ncbi:hypothetical protein ACN2AY_29335, partial [Klebsiella pneumoniae]|uniref:hypothetical protein n=1 Tax=Klebsiella pneumoniae TaxID=573 RepID=UPI003AF8867D
QINSGVAAYGHGVAAVGHVARAGTSLLDQASRRGIARRELAVRKPQVAAQTAHSRALASLNDAQRVRVASEVDNLSASTQAYLARTAKEYEAARLAGHEGDIKAIESKLLKKNEFFRNYQIT